MDNLVGFVTAEPQWELLIVVLICISLIISDVFMCLLAIPMSFLDLLPIFQLSCFFFFGVVYDWFV